jgi:hypothetical protein
MFLSRYLVCSMEGLTMKLGRIVIAVLQELAEQNK